MSEEKQIYTIDELKEMSRVDLRKLSVKGWGMDNKECSNTKSADLREFIIAKQEEYQDQGDEKPTKSKASPKARASRPTSTAPKASAGRSRKEPKEPKEHAEDSDSDTARLDILGQAVDDNHAELKALLTEADTEYKDTLENVRMGMYVLHGLIADIYRNYYEPEDLKDRVDELAKEFNADAEGNV